MCPIVVAIGAALFAFQQFAGINAVFYFSSTVFRAAGMTSDVAASVSVGAINLLGALNRLISLFLLLLLLLLLLLDKFMT